MSETVLTSPIILDATGQDMLTKLDSIISAINPVAQGVSYDNAGTGMVANNVQSAITELKTGLVNTNSSLTNLIKSKNISGTTNSGGAVSSGLYAGNSPIIHVVIYSAGATYFGTISQVSESSDLQYITVHNTNGAIVASTAITGIVYYVDLTTI